MNCWDLIVLIFVVGVLGIMMLFLFSMVFDVLLVVNITFSFVIMLIFMYISKLLEFSVFLVLLLVIIFYCLVINVSITCCILLEGYIGMGSVGQVIETFGNFVVGGNYVVGLVVFLILIIINFVVIIKGVGCIVEVSVRFILDVLFGK